MSDDLSSALSWIANYSSFYSVLTVLICFIFMVVFILSMYTFVGILGQQNKQCCRPCNPALGNDSDTGARRCKFCCNRLNGDLLLPGTATHHRVVEEQSMLGLQNPFSVHLLKKKISSLKDGVYLDISVLDTTLLAVVWGVNIQAFQQELQLKSSEIWERFKEQKMFGGKYMDYKDCGQLGTDITNNELYIECPPSVTEATLGEPPRIMYPIVIVTVRQSPDISLDYTAIVLQFTVLHLKDSVCSLDSHIVYQFLKTNHNQILSLQPIFVSTTDSDDSTGHSNQTQAQTPKTFHSTSKSGTATHKQVTNQETSHERDYCRETENSVENRSNLHAKETRSLNKDFVSESSKTCTRDGTSTRDASSHSTYDASQGEQNDGMSSTESHPLKDTRRNSDVLKDESNLCVVCQNSPIFYTLLLCRHACVCHSCIKLLDRCPMCRGFIDSYFRLGDVPDPPLTENDGTGGAPRLPWWEALNNRLNHMLGFD